MLSSAPVAFITCVYRGNENYDYKSAPLQKLEEHLSKTYDRVVVVSDEDGVFPNGDLDFFLRNGYEDEGIISEEAGYCKLHLLSKNLRKVTPSRSVWAKIEFNL